MKEEIVITITLLIIFSIAYIVGYKTHTNEDIIMFEACDEYCFHGFNDRPSASFPIGYTYDFKNDTYTCLCEDGINGWFN